MPILIKTNFSRRNQTTRCTPEVPNNFDRYEDYKARQRNIERVAQGNNYPWKWREKPKS